VARGPRITNLMFVDDVILFGNGSIAKWESFKKVLDLFCKVIGMDFNSQNSVFLEAGWEVGELVLLKALLPFEVKPIDEDFKYMGFF